MPDITYGRHSLNDAAKKNSPKLSQLPFFNNLTRRNVELSERMPMRLPSSCLQSANLKSLRLFRHICRLMPFIIRIHEIPQRVTPVQSKRFVANHFRKYSKETDLALIDEQIQFGYETVYEAQMQYSNTGYLYRFICPPQTHNFRDHGINRLIENKADRINEKPDSKFLVQFYKGRKSHDN